MSTWISDTGRARALLPRRALLFFSLLPLCGCLAGVGAGTAPRQAEFYGGAVVVGGPPGYCIDPRSLRRGPGGGFALLAACDRLQGQPDGNGVPPAVMTVSVMPYRAGLQQPGAADLAASVAPAQVLERRQQPGLALVRLAEPDTAPLPQGNPRYWRGAMAINGHLTGLAVYGARGGTLDGDEGRRLITALARALRAGNPAEPAPAPETGTAPGGTAGGQGAAPRGLAAIFGGLFPVSD